jgi:Ca2+-binding RTX toxin-like protein
VSSVINLGNAGNSATLSTVDTLTSGSGSDTIVFTGPISHASIDLGAGADTLTLGNGANTATIANTETIAGGTGNDTVTLGTALTTGMSVDLGGGSNTLDTLRDKTTLETLWSSGEAPWKVW